MSALFALWIFAAPATPTPTPAPKRIAVVVVGDDAAACGDLQRELEKRLPAAAPGLVVRPAADVAARAAAPRAASAATELDPATAAALEQAIGAYYDAQYVKALDLFAKVQAQYDASGAPFSKKTEVFLWRVAVFLGLNDAAQAQAEALAALTLNPEIKIDATSEIPPSVQQQLDLAKKSPGFKIVTVIVNGLPATATLSVDGRSVPSRFKVTAGKHVIVASSAGRRDVSREIDVNSDTALSMSLPIALAPDEQAAVTAFLVGGEESAGVAALATKLDADWVLFALTSPTVVTSALRRSATADAHRGEAVSVTEAPGTFLELYQSRLVKSLNEKVPPPPGVAAAPGSWAIRADGTIVASGWSRSVSGGETFQTFFGGAGPEVRVEATRDSLLFVGAASFVSYDASSVDVRLPDGSRTTATGGSTNRLLLGGGWRGLGREQELVRGVLALDVETHAANDPANQGAKLNLLTSYTRAAIELRAGSRFPAPALPDWRVDVELGVAPYSYFAESPSGASGKSPAAGLGYLWSAGLESAAASRWGYRLAYSGEMRSVKFKGASDAAVNPPMRNAELSEMTHALSLSLSRRF